MKLTDARHAFITGGASGIGLAIADALTHLGIAVTIADIDADSLEQVLADRAGKLHGVTLDTRDRQQWQAARAAAEAQYGPVDILVNNAGIAPNGRDFADMNPESFDRIIGINLTGVFNGVATFAADMRGRQQGHIVNTASLAGLTPGMPGLGAYSISKYGVVTLSEGLRQELAPHNVGVSVVCPGLVTTNLAENTLKVGGELRGGSGKMPESGISSADVARRVLEGIANNRLYILTHPGSWPAVKSRFEAIEQAFADFEQSER